MNWNKELLQYPVIQGWQCLIYMKIYEESGFCYLVHHVDTAAGIIEIAVKLKPFIPILTDELVQ